MDNTGCKSKRESGGVTNVNEIREVTWKEIHAIRSSGSKNKCGEGSALKTGDVVTGEGGGGGQHWVQIEKGKWGGGE